MKVTLAENGGRVTAKAESGERQDIAVLCVTQISGRCKTAAAALRKDVSLFLFPSLYPKSGELVEARRTHPDITLLTPH